MKYKTINILVGVIFAVGSILFLTAGLALVRLSTWIMAGFLFLSFLCWLVFIFPQLLKGARRFAISRFGSRADEELRVHFSDVFFTRQFAGRISTQVNIRDREDMEVFAVNLVKIFAPEAVQEAQEYYPEILGQYWTDCFESLANVERSAMELVCFPEKDDGTYLKETAGEVLRTYPFVSKAIWDHLIRWWMDFKAKMVWQDRMDGIER